MIFISYGTHTVPMQDLQGCRTQPYRHGRESTQEDFAKVPHRRCIWPYRGRKSPSRSPHGLFTGWLRSLKLYGACKLIMHALKLYGSRTERQNSSSTTRGPYRPCVALWVDVRLLFKIRQLTAWEQPVQGPGVWCDWGITKYFHDTVLKIQSQVPVIYYEEFD